MELLIVFRVILISPEPLVFGNNIWGLLDATMADDLVTDDYMSSLGWAINRVEDNDPDDFENIIDHEMINHYLVH